MITQEYIRAGEPPTRHIFRTPEEPIGPKPICAMNLDEFIDMMEKAEKPTLKFKVKAWVFDLVKTGEVDIITRSRNAYNNVRLVNSFGKALEYVYVEIANGKRRVTCEYNSVFISNSDHFLKYNDNKPFRVDKGSYIIKLGRVIKIVE